MTTDNKAAAAAAFEAAFQPLTISNPPRHVTVIQDGRLELADEDMVPSRYENDAELAELVTALIERNVAFLDGPAGWPPAEVVRSLQERGLVTKDFLGIVWHGDGLFRTYDIAYQPSA